MLHGRPSALALTSVGGIFAAIIGVQLGQSAISEINPIHFQGALERPQGITPPPEPTPYDPYAREYVWSLPPDPTLFNCGPNCDGVQSGPVMQVALDSSAGRDASLPYWRDATPASELRPWPPGEMPNAGVQLERYMRYPVNREQAEQAEAEAAQAQARVELPAPAATAAPAEALRVPAELSEPIAEE